MKEVLHVHTKDPGQREVVLVEAGQGTTTITSNLRAGLERGYDSASVVLRQTVGAKVVLFTLDRQEVEALIDLYQVHSLEFVAWLASQAPGGPTEPGRKPRRPREAPNA